MSEQTHPAWGERRRRREEERRHVTGEQPVAAMPPAMVPPEPPLSRRELRERAAAEAARAAEALAAPVREAAPRPAPQPQPGAPVPYVPTAPAVRAPAAGYPAASNRAPIAPPAPVADPSAQAPSRRELRERIAAQRQAAAAASAAYSPGTAAPAAAPQAAPPSSPGRPAYGPPAASRAVSAPPVAAPQVVAPTVVPRMEPERPAQAPPAALSPQARAAAIRAQAARAQAERAEAARGGAEREQSARGATQRSVVEPPQSIWAQRAQESGSQDSARRMPPTAATGPTGHPAEPSASARSAAPVGSSPVRRVVLPPSAVPDAAATQAPGHRGGAPVTPARPTLAPYQPQAQSFGAGRGAPYQPEPAPAAPAASGPYQPHAGPPARPAGAGGWQSDVRPFVAPVAPQAAAMTAPVQAIQPASGPTPQTFTPGGFGAWPGGAEAAPTAFVPAGVPPVVGQSFGTLQAAPTGATVTGEPFGASPQSRADSADTAFDEPDGMAGPRWGSVTPAQGWTATPTPARAAFVAPAVDDELEPDEPLTEMPRHPYTWLHMIVLVLVAFVLGMLIFVVLLRDSGAGGTQGAGTVSDVVAWSRAAVLTAGAGL